MLGLITENAKLSLYSNWTPGTVDIAMDRRQQGEYYDKATPGGQMETVNTYGPSSSPQVHVSGVNPQAEAMETWLLTDLLPNELRAPLPKSLSAAQSASKQQLIDYYLSQQSSREFIRIPTF